MISATIKGIDFYLPEKVLGNDQLTAEFPDWSVNKIAKKTGIVSRRIAAEDECSSDLAIAAANKLFEQGFDRSQIDFILLCTQSPDYYLPTTACLLQDALRIPTNAGALDFNLGCSGYIYGLGLAKGLIETEQAKNVLLITAETYSKFLDPADRSVRTIFGDAAAATVLSAETSERPQLGPFVYGTDGKGAEHLIVRNGLRDRNKSSNPFLHMNGPEIFAFTLRSVPRLVDQVLTQANLKITEIDFFVFHQANKFMIEHLRDKIGISAEKFAVCLSECGNTVSSSIPIALKMACDSGQIQPGSKIMLVGFGVGYSWGATLLTWNCAP